ncbi:hypothetical protein EDB83DRAFT_2318259 [Lactarius deliciosus]|nr:hypothetical protein EDB83DRAFT_2318259 [Lactarius deliciosus]
MYRAGLRGAWAVVCPGSGVIVVVRGVHQCTAMMYHPTKQASDLIQQHTILPITQDPSIIAQAQSDTGKIDTFSIATFPSINIATRFYDPTTPTYCTGTLYCPTWPQSNRSSLTVVSEAMQDKCYSDTQWPSWQGMGHSVMTVTTTQYRLRIPSTAPQHTDWPIDERESSPTRSRRYWHYVLYTPLY